MQITRPREETVVERPEIDEAITQVIRPAAIIPEAAARAILTGMAVSSVYTDGLWLAEPSRWVRYDRAWTQPLETGRTSRLGTIRVTYGMPTKYEITLFQVAVTQAGMDAGMTPQDLADEALAFGGLTLAGCPRAPVTVPPKPFRY
jgi:hypothetical protein